MTLEALDLEPFGFLPLAGGGGDDGGDAGGDASGDGGGPSGDDGGNDGPASDSGGYDPSAGDDNMGGPAAAAAAAAAPSGSEGSDPGDGTGIAGGRSAGRGGPTAAAVNAMNTIGVHNATEQGFAQALGKAAQTGLSSKVAGGALGLMGAMTPGMTGTAIGLAGKATRGGNFGLNTHGATWGDVFSQSVPAGVNAMAQSLGIAPEAVAEGLAAANESMMAQNNEIMGDPIDALGDTDDYQAGGRYDPNRFMPEKTGLAPEKPAAPEAPKTVGGIYTPPVPDYVKRYASGSWGGPTG